ncbi:MAG: response regulator [Acidimicrobiia bacterium]|nr:response regulator [Acidimicrobiia bacterium]
MTGSPSAEAAGSQAASATRRVRVLVVEDNTINQLLVGHQLTRLGYDHEIVGVATSALELLADPDHGFDVVLMDWQLPGIDGLEATRRIRQLECGSGRHVPIIALTASALTTDRLACRDAGMDDFVAKPASISTLGEAISRCATGPGSGAALSETGGQARAATTSGIASASTGRDSR